MTLRKRLGLAMPVALYEKISNKAKYQGKTINSLCLDIFWEYFEQRECRKVNSTGEQREPAGIAENV